MAFVSDYKFHNKTRIGEDSCDISQRNVQNVNFSNYMLNNYRPDCPMSNAIEFATSQPMVNFRGSHQVGIGGCNINSNSELLITNILYRFNLHVYNCHSHGHYQLLSVKPHY